jgi:multidrug efflux pump subunit AcrB
MTSSGPGAPQTSQRGPLAWFARNIVAANVFMVLILVGGLLMMGQIKQEVFPEIEFELVIVNIPYPGASPLEVERAVVLAAEEAVRGIDGVKAVTSTASEGFGVLVVELLLGTNPDRALADVKSAIDRVTSFPADVERPVTFLASNRFRVVSLMVHGDVEERALRQLAEQARDELLDDPRITYVELKGVRPPEISIEVPQASLRQHGLTLADIAAGVRAASVELPGGAVKTPRGEVLLRTDERRETGAEFAAIVLRARPDGSELRVGDLGVVRDTFADNDQAAFFNGQPAAMLEVFRVGDETPMEVSAAVKEYIALKQPTLPEGVRLATWFDASEFYEDRINLLVRNAGYGLVLVLLILGIFLEMRLAFWVTLGIPISFIGAMLFLPSANVSINMLSLFAFIVVLGMVVDDAIVVGEAVYKHRQDGLPRLQAAIAGVREVAVPVTFAIATTMIAFAPMLFVPGFAGKFFRNIPVVVIIVLALSLFESLIILPAHLAHSKEPSSRGVFGWIHHQQQRVSRGIEWLIRRTYVPLLVRAAHRRYLTLAIAVAIFIAAVGLVAGGRIGFVFMPKIESDVAVALLEMPYGASPETTRAHMAHLQATARKTLAELGDPAREVRGVFAQIGALSMAAMGGPGGARTSTGGHLAEVAVYLVPASERAFTAQEFTRRWRAAAGELAGADSLKFTFDTGGSGQAPVAFDLSHPDPVRLERAAAELAARMDRFAGVFDVDNGTAPGKEQLDFRLKPEGKAAGVTETELARQVRSAFFGAEAQRLQRGRDELRVYVRLPEADRRSEHDIETLRIRTPGGGELPLGVAAEVTRGRSYTEIRRRDGRRIAEVTADVDPAVTNANQVVERVIATDLPELMARDPDLTWSFGGEQRDQAEIMDSLGRLFLLALIAMFALLAVAFRSYIQPVIIMMAIPFGMVGAIVGHLLMGFDLSLMSMMGVVALSGVVVNDSLIYVVAINEYRAQGLSAADAVRAGGARRFRPILLTSLTTFGGLAPMLFETSVQARFLIPMAISLGFGIIFASFIILLLVPALYMGLEDARLALRWGSQKLARPVPETEEG